MRASGKKVVEVREEVDLSRQALTSVPFRVFKLDDLKVLNVAHNNLTELSDSLEKLVHLEDLFLHGNSITSLPDVFDKLTGLRRVQLQGNLLTAVPPSFAALTSLEHLNIDSNRLRKFPAPVCQCTGLLVLNLAENLIGQVPPEIGQLVNLQQLHLHHNRIKFIPHEVVHCHQLAELYLEHNAIAFVPKHLHFMNKLKHLHLAGNHILNVPLSVRRKGTKRIKKYLKKQTKGDRHPYCRVKLMLVGQENVGKTSLMTQLRGSKREEVFSSKTVGYSLILQDEMDEKYKREEAAREDKSSLSSSSSSSSSSSNLGLSGGTSTSEGLQSRWMSNKNTKAQLSTDGIDIHYWRLNSKDKQTEVEFNSWDFAGQEVYYLTHQFFITDIGIYFILWNMTASEEESKLEYWLESIKARANDPPVIIIGTHLDQVKDLARVDAIRDKITTKYCARFPNIRYVVEVDARRGKKLGDLKSKLIELALEIGHSSADISPQMLLLETLVWYERLIKANPVISMAKWKQIGKQAGIRDHNHLMKATKRLHDFGSLMYFDEDTMDDLVILEPQFLTQLMASVISTKFMFSGGGVFEHVNIDHVWKAPMFPTEYTKQFLLLLQRFEVMYKLPDDAIKGYEYGEKSLIPWFLPEQYFLLDVAWPDSVPKDVVSNGRLYCFEFYPIGLFSRLLIRVLMFTEYNQKKWVVEYWKRGILLKHDENHMIVRSDDVKRQISIEVRGKEPYRLLVMLCDQLDQLLEDWFPYLKFNVFVQCSHCFRRNTKPPRRFRLADVEKALYNGWKSIECEDENGQTDAVLTKDLMLDYLGPEQRIRWRDVEQGEVIGLGSFATINRGKWNGKDVAIKRHLAKQPIIGDISMPSVDVESITQGFSRTKSFFALNNNVTKPAQSSPLGSPNPSPRVSPGRWSKPVEDAGPPSPSSSPSPPSLPLSSSLSSSSPVKKVKSVTSPRAKRLRATSGGAISKMSKFKGKKKKSANSTFTSQPSLSPSRSPSRSPSPSPSPSSSPSSSPRPARRRLSSPVVMPRFRKNVSESVRSVEVPIGARDTLARRRNTNEDDTAQIRDQLDDADLVPLLKEFRREISLMASLTHDSVIQMVGYCLKPPAIVLDLCEEGDLFAYCEDSKNELPWDEILRLAIDIADALKYLHSLTPPLIHRDLKTPNILLTRSSGKLRAKVADLGLSRVMVQKFQGRSVWNPTWLAPEIILESEYDESVDIYSYGLCIWQMVAREKPFSHLKWAWQIEDFVKQGGRPDIPDHCPGFFRDLIERCWSTRLAGRPSFDEILEVLRRHVDEDGNALPLAEGMTESSLFQATSASDERPAESGADSPQSVLSLAAVADHPLKTHSQPSIHCNRCKTSAPVSVSLPVSPQISPALLGTSLRSSSPLSPLLELSTLNTAAMIDSQKYSLFDDMMFSQSGQAETSRRNQYRESPILRRGTNSPTISPYASSDGASSTSGSPSGLGCDSESDSGAGSPIQLRKRGASFGSERSLRLSNTDHSLSSSDCLSGIEAQRTVQIACKPTRSGSATVLSRPGKFSIATKGDSVGASARNSSVGAREDEKSDGSPHDVDLRGRSKSHGSTSVERPKSMPSVPECEETDGHTSSLIASAEAIAAMTLESSERERKKPDKLRKSRSKRLARSKKGGPSNLRHSRQGRSNSLAGQSERTLEREKRKKKQEDGEDDDARSRITKSTDDFLHKDNATRCAARLVRSADETLEKSHDDDDDDDDDDDAVDRDGNRDDDGGGGGGGGGGDRAGDDSGDAKSNRQRHIAKTLRRSSFSLRRRTASDAESHPSGPSSPTSSSSTAASSSTSRDGDGCNSTSSSNSSGDGGDDSNSGDGSSSITSSSSSSSGSDSKSLSSDSGAGGIIGGGFGGGVGVVPLDVTGRRQKHPLRRSKSLDSRGRRAHGDQGGGGVDVDVGSSGSEKLSRSEKMIRSTQSENETDAAEAAPRTLRDSSVRLSVR